MSMTRQEYATKNYIQNKLAKEGYVTYSKILGDYDLNITKNPTVVGFMEPSKGRIVLNSGLDEDQVSTIIRHEILHYYLEHERRLLKKLCKEHNLDFDKVDDNSLEDIKKKLYSNDLFNKAADYEISNRGYTEKDKDIVRNILLNGQTLTGLVTEDEHPDWVDMSVEEMYDLLRKEQSEQNQEGSNDQQNQDQSDQNQQGQDQQDSSSTGQNSSSQNSQSDSSEKDDSQDSQSNGGNSSNKKPESDKSDSNDSNTSDNLDSDASEDSEDSSSSDNSSSQQGDKDSESDSSSSNSNSNSSDGDDSDNESQNSPSPSGSPNGEGKPQNRPPQIGDKGDEDFTAIEDAEREAQAEEEAKEYGFDPESDEEKQERLKRIQRSFDDAQVARDVSGEAEEKVRREKAKKAAKDLARYTNSPIKKFRDNLNRFIRNEVGRERTRTWKKENPSYEGSGIMRRGKAKTSNGKIPLINVYFDRSGSWNAAKTQVGQDAIATLNNYVRNGQIKINLYYFNTKIHSEDPGGTGGTRGTPIIEHIKQTKPDNVIIMTDSDIGDIDEGVTVPGAVWLLFKGGRSQNLIDHIRGRKQTNIYDLD